MGRMYSRKATERQNRIDMISRITEEIAERKADMYNHVGDNMTMFRVAHMKRQAQKKLQALQFSMR